MAKENKKSLFWTSYSDLMTSLFFTMLILFVIIVVAMGQTNRRLEHANKKLQGLLDTVTTTKEQLESIIHIKEQFQSLTKSSSLEYDKDKYMFYAKDFIGIEIFEPNKDTIKPEYIPTVDKVGNEIKHIIDTLNKDASNFKFQLVIEGTAAIPYSELINNTYDSDNQEMYFLSYKRALALYKRWEHLKFRDSNTEIIIAGSGFNGINRDQYREDNNKRFVIQIIPKIDRPSK